jgi:hypothetical protein
MVYTVSNLEQKKTAYFSSQRFGVSRLATASCIKMLAIKKHKKRNMSYHQASKLKLGSVLLAA